MDLLKAIAKDRLVIMVTHNPNLAKKYSTRTVKLLDGKVKGDTNPYKPDYGEAEISKVKKPSMSWWTAFSLSLNNLLTKKARTILTAFAGSIGIIGIALILSLSSGVNAYINRVEEDTLSSYPIEIEQSGINISDIISELVESTKNEPSGDPNTVISNNIMTDMMVSIINGSSENNLKLFKEYIESGNGNIKDYCSDVKYSYKTPLNVYTLGGYRVNPSNILELLGFVQAQTPYSSASSSSMRNNDVWRELLDNDELLYKQFEVTGHLPQSSNEVVIIVDKNNRISDYTLYCLGLKDASELTEMIKLAQSGEKIEKQEETSYSYDELLGLRFKVVLNSDYYVKDENGLWLDMSENNLYIHDLLESEKARELQVVGILKANSNSASSLAASGGIGYKGSLMTEVIEEINQSEIAKEQLADPTKDVFTGLQFESTDEYTMDDLNAYIASLPAKDQAMYNSSIAELKSKGNSDKDIVMLFEDYLKSGLSESTFEKNCELIGIADLAKPSMISLYPKDFEAKETLSKIISDYNNSVPEKDSITYTDYIGLMLSSVTTIINAISYILIAFVSISLIVSSIMIGIITYISVLERTKEIGILRAMGASKRDISNVFNAEAIIIGLFAGGIGICVTLLLLIPINAIIASLTEISGIASLPVAGGIALVVISTLLTFIAGLIPSRIAARKDPVIALRTE